MTRLQELFKMIEEPTDDCIVWPYSRTPQGYGRVQSGGRNVYPHRLALASVTPPPTDGHEAAHGSCHNPSCVNPRHLSWKTRTENQADRLRDGTDSRGEKHGRSKLTETDVREIRSMTGVSQRKMAEMFGVSRCHVSDIVNRKKWAHI